MFIRRRQYFVDRAVQGRIVTRTISQWFFCMMSVAIMLLCWRIATHPTENFISHAEALWNLVGPAFIGTLLLLPLVVIDVVKMTNRFVGSVLRIRSSMRQLAAGEDVRPIRLRDDDLWQDLAADFNALLARLVEAEDKIDTARAATKEAATVESSVVGLPVVGLPVVESPVVESAAEPSAEECLSIAMELAEDATQLKAPQAEESPLEESQPETSPTTSAL